jgi:tight adherence protein B
MGLLVAIAFLFIFAIVAIATLLGLKYQEDQRKKRVTATLRTGLGDAARVETKVLLEPEGMAAGLAKLLARFNFAKAMERRLAQSGLGWSLNTLLISMAGLAIPGALIGAWFKPLLFPELSTIAAAALFSTFPYLYMMRKRKKRLAAFEEQLPEALDFLGRAMRAGHAFSIALEMLSEESQDPLRQEFRKVHNEHNLGLPIDTALKNLAERVPLLDVKFFVSTVLLQRETGGNLAEILAKLADVIRERFKLKGQVMAISAQGRITAMTLTLIPIGLAIALLMISPTYLQSMAADPIGRYMLAGVVVGQGVGYFFIKRIVDIKV